MEKKKSVNLKTNQKKLSKLEKKYSRKNGQTLRAYGKISDSPTTYMKLEN